MEFAVEALKAGAFDFVSKPVNLELLRKLVDTALNLEPLSAEKPSCRLCFTLTISFLEAVGFMGMTVFWMNQRHRDGVA